MSDVSSDFHPEMDQIRTVDKNRSSSCKINALIKWINFNGCDNQSSRLNTFENLPQEIKKIHQHVPRKSATTIIISGNSGSRYRDG